MIPCVLVDSFGRSTPLALAALTAQVIVSLCTVQGVFALTADTDAEGRRIYRLADLRWQGKRRAA